MNPYQDIPVGPEPTLADITFCTGGHKGRPRVITTDADSGSWDGELSSSDRRALADNATDEETIEKVGIANIKPFSGYWINLDPEGDASLLPCETKFACVASADSSTTDELSLAACGPHFTGFMCKACEEGFIKIAGQCVECPGFDYPMMFVQVFIVSQFTTTHD